MKALFAFLAIVIAFTPLIVALVKAIADGVRESRGSGPPKWLKRVVAIVMGLGVAYVASYVLAQYGQPVPPLGVVLVCGAATGLNAAGIYDISKLINAAPKAPAKLIE